MMAFYATLLHPTCSPESLLFTAEQYMNTDQVICPLPTVKGTSYSFYSEKSSEGVLPGQRLQGSFRPGIEQLRRQNASLHGILPLQPISVL